MWHFPSNPSPDASRRWRTWLTASLLTMVMSAAAAVTARVEARGGSERGDVPGWVMVTLMTAGLVAIVWVLADDWLRQLFQQAVDRVSGP